MKRETVDKTPNGYINGFNLCGTYSAIEIGRTSELSSSLFSFRYSFVRSHTHDSGTSAQFHSSRRVCTMDSREKIWIWNREDKCRALPREIARWVDKQTRERVNFWIINSQFLLRYRSLVEIIFQPNYAVFLFNSSWQDSKSVSSSTPRLLKMILSLPTFF